MESGSVVQRGEQHNRAQGLSDVSLNLSVVSGNAPQPGSGACRAPEGIIVFPATGLAVV